MPQIVLFVSDSFSKTVCFLDEKMTPKLLLIRTFISKRLSDLGKICHCHPLRKMNAGFYILLYILLCRQN